VTSAARGDRDVVAWAIEQARFLRDCRLELLDVAHLDTEIEDVGKSEQRELRHYVAAAHIRWINKLRTRPGRESSHGAGNIAGSYDMPNALPGRIMCSCYIMRENWLSAWPCLLAYRLKWHREPRHRRRKLAGHHPQPAPQHRPPIVRDSKPTPKAHRGRLVGRPQGRRYRPSGRADRTLRFSGDLSLGTDRRSWIRSGCPTDSVKHPDQSMYVQAERVSWSDPITHTT
jgi:hypothetical protein